MPATAHPAPWLALIALMIAPPALLAQARDSVPASSACWRFAFGAWTPPLDWAKSGHPGQAGDLADRVRRVRDSVFLKDPGAAGNNAMYWERTAKGLAVVS